MDGAKTVFVREPFSLLATYPQTVLVSLLALICLYLFHSADKLFGILGIFVGSLSIIIAIYSIESTTKKLDASIKQLSEIQIDYWNTRGIDQYKQKKYREADQSYERAISLNQNDAKIWTNIAVSLYEQKMLDEALYAIIKL